MTDSCLDRNHRQVGELVVQVTDMSLTFLQAPRDLREPEAHLEEAAEELREVAGLAEGLQGAEAAAALATGVVEAVAEGSEVGEEEDSAVEAQAEAVVSEAGEDDIDLGISNGRYKAAISAFKAGGLLSGGLTKTGLED